MQFLFQCFFTITFLLYPFLGYTFEKTIQKPQYLAIIFNCDGVLVDTEFLKFQAWKKALQKNGIIFHIEDYIPLVGYNSKHILKSINKAHQNCLSSIDFENIRQHRARIYQSLQEQGIPKLQSAVDLAFYLFHNKKKLHIQCALTSFSSQTEIMRTLQSIGLENAFEIIISGHDHLKALTDSTKSHPSKPSIYQKLAQRLHVNPEDCLVFENTKAGVETAFRAGMTVFAVPNALTQHQDFSKAAKVINDLSQLNIEEILYPFIDLTIQ